LRQPRRSTGMGWFMVHEPWFNDSWCQQTMTSVRSGITQHSANAAIHELYIYTWIHAHHAQDICIHFCIYIYAYILLHT
jgi:hypothetical protein